MRNQAWQKRAVIDEIRKQGESTRPEISRAAGLSLPALTTLTRELLDSGLVVQNGYRRAPRGRHAATLQINPSLCSVVGLHLTPRRLAGVVANARGEVRLERQATFIELTGSADAIDCVKKLARELLAVADRDGAICGVASLGIGLSGLVRKDRRTSREFPGLADWEDVPLGGVLAEEFGVPTVLMNDVRAATLAEHRAGAAKGIDDFLYLHMGRGMGMGIVAGGELYTGGNNFAGELGHCVVDPEGPICFCGNYGCLESLVAPSALVSQCVEAMSKGVQTSAGAEPGDVTIFKLLQAANEGDRLASNIVTAAGQHLGRLIANLVNLLNPSAVVLGGFFAAPEARLLNRATLQEFRSKVIPVLRDETIVKRALLGQNAAALGAVMSALDEFFGPGSAEMDRLLGKRSS